MQGGVAVRRAGALRAAPAGVQGAREGRAGGVRARGGGPSAGRAAGRAAGRSGARRAARRACRARAGRAPQRAAGRACCGRRPRAELGRRVGEAGVGAAWRGRRFWRRACAGQAAASPAQGRLTAGLRAARCQTRRLGTSSCVTVRAAHGAPAARSGGGRPAGRLRREGAGRLRHASCRLSCLSRQLRLRKFLQERRRARRLSRLVVGGRLGRSDIVCLTGFCLGQSFWSCERCLQSSEGRWSVICTASRLLLTFRTRLVPCIMQSY